MIAVDRGVPGLRVMTYNIRNGRGADNRVDLGRIARVIAGSEPDVVALQEVDVCRPRSGGVDQGHELATRLGMEACFAPCIVADDGRYGIATLSRWPVEACRVVELPHRADHEKSEPRRALITRLRWPGRERPLDVVNTHLSVLGAERVDQVIMLERALGPDDVIVAGDLNCGRRGAPYRALCGRLRPASRRLRTWPALLPLIELDHVLYRGALRPVSAGVWTRAPERRASGHLPVVVTFEPVEAAA